MDETEEVFKLIEPTCGKITASGIPVGFEWDCKTIQVVKQKEAAFLYLPDGGCICLYRNGTWGGDIAPFCG